MKKHSAAQTETGAIIVTILFIMLFFVSVTAGLVLLSTATLDRSRGRVLLLEAQYAAESGADAAISTLNYTNSNFTGTASDVTVLSNSRYKATFATTVVNSGSNKVITSTGKIYQPATAATPSYTRTVIVTAQETSGTTASGLMSTNNLILGSSVKNVIGSSIYLNGFVNLTKNVNNLSFSSLTVAGKDTGVKNCSIEGSGTLSNNPSTSKATIDVAYNNCITPPANTSNTNFNVTANDSSISPVQSLYIPPSAYMDSTYSNSPGGCSDWTASGTTLSIPSTGNTKKTHYPDSGSGVTSSCGTSGNINLGSKTVNISDNAHLRANLCSTSACTPTFNNTSGTLKYLFVEGTVNFNSLNIVSGSSPLVIFAYGADPATHNGCPYGDSVYLGNSGYTSASSIYLLALNGVCLDSTKFSTTPALAGVGGKNIYIATNSGTPFDLSLNSSFPLSQIPVNLTWKATGYERK